MIFKCIADDSFKGKYLIIDMMGSSWRWSFHHSWTTESNIDDFFKAIYNQKTDYLLVSSFKEYQKLLK